MTAKTIEVNNNFSKLKEGLANAFQPQKPKRQEWPKPTDEQKELLQTYMNGLNWPHQQLTGNKLIEAEALYKRYK